MKSVYHHHRAASLWSRGRSSEDPAVIADCANELERYNYPDHAAILRDKLPPPQPAEAETVEVAVVVAPKRARAKRAKKES